jgi:hypothetical protein
MSDKARRARRTDKAILYQIGRSEAQPDFYLRGRARKRYRLASGCVLVDLCVFGFDRITLDKLERETAAMERAAMYNAVYAHQD